MYDLLIDKVKTLLINIKKTPNRSYSARYILAKQIELEDSYKQFSELINNNEQKLDGRTIEEYVEKFRKNYKEFKNILALKAQEINKEDSEGSEEEIENLSVNSIQNPRKQITIMDKVQFLKLASATINYTFSGEILKLQSFIDSIELLESMADTNDTKKLLVSFVKTKIDGVAREQLPEDCDSIKKIIESLKKNIKVESSKIIEARMIGVRLDRENQQSFSKRAEELSECFRRSLVFEGIPAMKADEMTIEKTIELCRKNAQSDLVKAVLASTKFESPKEVIAKMIVEANTEKAETNVLAYRAYNTNYNSTNGSSNSSNSQNYRRNNKGISYFGNGNNYRNYNRNNNKNYRNPSRGSYHQGQKKYNTRGGYNNSSRYNSNNTKSYNVKCLENGTQGNSPVPHPENMGEYQD